MKILQIIILMILFINFLSGLYTDINGRKAKEPYGFMGALITIIFTIALFLLYYYAGAFNKIF